MAGPVRPESGPTPFRHLAHVPSFRENPIVFFITCTSQRRKILASPHCHTILREIWERSADRDGLWVGHYVLMPDHVHFFARPEIGARRMADWVQMWKSVSSRTNRGGAFHRFAHLADGLFRSISAIQRNLFRKMALR